MLLDIPRELWQGQIMEKRGCVLGYRRSISEHAPAVVLRIVLWCGYAPSLRMYRFSSLSGIQMRM